MLRLRPFETSDLPALQRVRAAAFRSVFDSFRLLTGPEIALIAFASSDDEQSKLLDDICRDNDKHHVLVAVADDEVVGFVSFTADVSTQMGEIRLNAVHPDHAGRGIGTCMYDEALTRMKALGVLVAEVSTGGDDSHAPARRAYEKVGFGPTIPAVTFYKRL